MAGKTDAPETLEGNLKVKDIEVNIRGEIFSYSVFFAPPFKFKDCRQVIGEAVIAELASQGHKIPKKHAKKFARGTFPSWENFVLAPHVVVVPYLDDEVKLSITPADDNDSGEYTEEEVKAVVAQIIVKKLDRDGYSIIPEDTHLFSGGTFDGWEGSLDV